MRFAYDVVAVLENMGLAQWHASFVRIQSGNRVEIDGILSAEFDDDGKCVVFREWWHRQECGDGSSRQPAQDYARSKEWRPQRNGARTPLHGLTDTQAAMIRCLERLVAQHFPAGRVFTYGFANARDIWIPVAIQTRKTDNNARESLVGTSPGHWAQVGGLKVQSAVKYTRV